MNTNRARAYGLVFKLKYTFPTREQPRLEVFLDNEITRLQDWEIYGVGGLSEPFCEPPDFSRYLEFEETGQIKHFELGQTYQIEFTGMSEEEVNYRRTGKKLEPAYHFHVVALSADDC